MYFDGSKIIQGAGAGVVLISPQGDKLKYVLRMSFPQASNNEAEYEALLHGMKIAKACGATRLKIFGDSNLVIQQVMNKCDAISDNMTVYRNLYYYLEGTFDGCEVSHISRASNEEADNLANIGSQCLPVLQGVFWEEIIERSIKNNKTSTTEEQGQHQATGPGAKKASIAETEKVMMIEET
jgi:ribonuclease HI